MKGLLKYLFITVIIIASITAFILPSNAFINPSGAFVFVAPPDTIQTIQPSSDTTNKGPLPYPFHDNDGYPFSNSNRPALYGKDPSNIKTETEYDPSSNNYMFYEKIGNSNFRTPRTLSFEEYKNYNFEDGMRNYWKQKAKSESFSSRTSLIPQLHVGGEAFDRIFGGNTIDIKPQGSAEIIFGLKTDKTDNPTLPERQRKTTSFDFKEKIQMNVQGKIGDKLKLSVVYNTEATFDFENSIKIEYTGYDDEIIQKIEAGNVSLPLTGSLITGSQSLFGIKTELKFGKLNVTTVFSQQKGQTSTIEVKGGAQTSNYEVSCDNYEANKHFFLGHYFEANYNNALSNLPIINSSVNITKIEVWVSNKSSNYENARNIVALMDIGEGEIFQSPLIHRINGGIYPYDSINNIRQLIDYNNIRGINTITNTLNGLGFTSADYEKLESARKLSETEYTFNSKLGYISLSSALNADEVLAVAYEFTAGGKIYRVGEFSNGGVSAPNALVVKLLKGTSLTPRYKNWRLMMKNIYSIGAYQVSNDDFRMDVLYDNPKTGVATNYIPEGVIEKKPLLEVLNLDKLNSQLDPHPDGMFDFIDKVTVNASNGRVIFPVLQPFGKFLRSKITGGDSSKNEIANRYVYQELYDSTQNMARQIAEKNKFKLKGSYKSSVSSDIPLNALNVPKGSVKVTAGGRPLTEDVDFTVNYTLGRVKIINQGLLESGTPIQISLENNSLFSIQSKSLIGSRFNYEVNKDLAFGGTVLNLTERPLTQKVNIGDEPISNTIWGLDGTYKTEVPFLTKLIDKLPFINTKEKSTLLISGEFAQLIPGHSRAIDKKGTSYIDDFEGSKTPMDIKSFNAWFIASTPGGIENRNLFPENNLISTDPNITRAYGFNRAKIAWYSIDPLFLRNNSQTPTHIKNDKNTQSSHFVREIFEQEIFPYKEPQNGVPNNMAVLNVGFYPTEKGPYNYDMAGMSGFSHGIDSLGKLTFPQTRWGGIMRKIDQSDFETANIEHIEFWLMDPFVEDADHTNTGGELYFNLGNISEDILKDSRKAFENGLYSSDNIAHVDTTAWGRVPNIQSVTYTFDNDPAIRKAQDVGLDGLNDGDENSFFNNYLADIATKYTVNSVAYSQALSDPSNDDYHYFKGGDFDGQNLGILDRYKKYNGMEGNSPTGGTESASSTPDFEDINRDNTLSETESYYQYKVNLKPQNFEVGTNYITDKIEYNAKLANGNMSKVTWYQFKIPITEWEKRVGEIQDFKSIRFVRMFMRGFSQPIILRFARLDLVRSEWRKYQYSFMSPGEYIPIELPETQFEISAVNIEENGRRIPINYVLPPGISRVIDPSNPQLRQLNEQSIVLRVADLQDGDARAAFKNVTMDIRKYKRLKMDVHAEKLNDMPLNDKDMTVFIRLGTDYKDNFYEYEIPVKITPSGNYDNDNDDDRKIVWPDENHFDIPLEIFQQIKQERNEQMRVSGSVVTSNTLFKAPDGQNMVSVMGYPNLSSVRTIMIGVRNPKKSGSSTSDDGLEKSSEIWLDELRLTDFDEKGGWAATARIQAKLADFGNVSLSGMTIKPGFGSIEKKVSERYKEDIYQYDISSNFQLGKFFPEKSGINIPMYVGFAESFKNPEYNPLEPDVPFSQALNDPNLTAEYKNKLKKVGQDYSKRKSMNFTNVKINKAQGKPHIYDISNWSVSYAFTETNSHNISTEMYNQRTHNGGIAFNYNTTPKTLAPFKNASFMKSPSWKIIKDMNLNLTPSQLAFRTNMNKEYDERKLRNVNNLEISAFNQGDNYSIPATFTKNFGWIRQYDLKYDITQALKFDFSATNTSRIDEPDGKIYRENKDSMTVYREKVFDEINKFGRTTDYHHIANLSYDLPLNKIPLFNWITANARYSGTYNWEAGPQLSQTDTSTMNMNLGNIIKNSNTMQGNATFNLLSLYNKVKFLKDVNQKFSKSGKKPDPKKSEKVTIDIDLAYLKAETPKTITHKLKTEEVVVKVYDSAGVEIKGDVKIINENKIIFKTKKDHKNVKVKITGTREIPVSLLRLIAEYSARFLMSTKNIQIQYSENNGSILPGYMPKTRYFGMEDFTPDENIFGQQGTMRGPNIPFIIGLQDTAFARLMGEQHMLTTSFIMNSPFVMTHTNTLNLRASLEPITDMRLDLNANKSFGENTSRWFTASADNPHYNDVTKQITGTFSMSVITANTAFEAIKKGNYQSKAFDQFRKNRKTISDRLAQQRSSYDPSNADTTNIYMMGYGRDLQTVLIPAFLAAYTGQSADRISLKESSFEKAFPTFLSMRPNWSVNYNGLNKLSFVKRWIKTATLTHAYRSTFSIGGYTTSSQYDYLGESNDGFSYVRYELQSNFLPKFEINSITINEQFSPLIGLDLTWNNSLITKFEMKKTRTLALGFSNNQLNENKSNEYVIGTGYRIKDVQITLKQIGAGGKSKNYKSDINIRVDLSIRNSLTLIRKLEEGVTMPTAGQTNITIKTSADYTLSDRFIIKVFYDKTITNPKISTTYRTSQANFGVSIRFQLVN